MDEGRRLPETTAPAEDTPPAELVRAHLERMLADPAWQGTPRRGDMLRFIVEETLAGRGDRLKGAAVAMAVFGRTADFDPQTDAVVRVEARRLRRDLDSYYAGRRGDDGVRIFVPKGGYVPRIIHDPPPEATAAGPQPQGGSGKGPPTRPRIVRRLAAVAVVCLTFGGALLWSVSVSTRGDPAPAFRGPSVVVLPFTPLGETNEAPALAAGLTYEVIGGLMRFPDFRVYTAEESFRLDGATNPLVAGERLQAAFAVRGAVRFVANELVVDAQLIDLRDGRVAWSRSFRDTPTARSVLAIQSEIAANIASEIGQPYGRIREALTDRIARVGDPSMEGYLCVLGAYAYRRTNRTELYPQTRTCLEETAAREPDYAEAWALLTYLRLDALRFGYAPEVAEEEALDHAAAAARKALALDPENVHALLALSLVEHYAGRHAEGDRVGRRAIEINPHDPDALARLGWRLALRGDVDQAIGYLEKAVERSVNAPPWYFHGIFLHRLVHDDPAGMLAAAEASMADGSAISLALLAIAEGRRGRPEAALDAVRRMEQRWPLLGRDPAAAFGMHKVDPRIVAQIVAGLRAAGWEPPDAVDG